MVLRIPSAARPMPVPGREGGTRPGPAAAEAPGDSRAAGDGRRPGRTPREWRKKERVASTARAPGAPGAGRAARPGLPAALGRAHLRPSPRSRTSGPRVSEDSTFPSLKPLFVVLLLQPPRQTYRFCRASPVHPLPVVNHASRREGRAGRRREEALDSLGEQRSHPHQRTSISRASSACLWRLSTHSLRFP